jgi:hypothetical protein
MSGALEAGGDGAVEVLLPGDVHLVHDVAPEHEALLDRHVHRVLVHREGRGVVHLVGAGVVPVQEVDDVLAGFELHERGAVVDTELGESGTHVPEHDPVVGPGVAARRAVAEELPLGEELLVDLETGDEPDRGVVEDVVLGGAGTHARHRRGADGGSGIGRRRGVQGGGVRGREDNTRRGVGAAGAGAQGAGSRGPAGRSDAAITRFRPACFAA